MIGHLAEGRKYDCLLQGIFIEMWWIGKQIPINELQSVPGLGLVPGLNWNPLENARLSIYVSNSKRAPAFSQILQSGRSPVSNWFHGYLSRHLSPLQVMPSEGPCRSEKVFWKFVLYYWCIHQREASLQISVLLIFVCGSSILLSSAS